MGPGQSCKISGVAKELRCFIADNIISKETGKRVWKVGPYYDDTARKRVGLDHRAAPCAYEIPKGLPGEGHWFTTMVTGPVTVPPTRAVPQERKMY